MNVRILVLIAITLLQQFTTSAQTTEPGHFSMVPTHGDPPARYDHHTRFDRWCAVHQAGVITLCAGGAGMLVGIGLSDAEGHPGFTILNTGDVITLLSAGAFIVGVNLAVAGRIYDHYHPRKFTLVAPRKNELGLAYHF